MDLADVALFRAIASVGLASGRGAVNGRTSMRKVAVCAELGLITPKTRKQFFFEKKNQKTFVPYTHPRGYAGGTHAGSNR
jgi:hypothetical protein